MNAARHPFDPAALQAHLQLYAEASERAYRRTAIADHRGAARAYRDAMHLLLDHVNGVSGCTAPSLHERIEQFRLRDVAEYAPAVGLEIAAELVPELGLGAGEQLEHGAVAAVHAHDEHAAPPVDGDHHAGVNVHVPSLRQPPRRYEVVDRWEQVAGVDEIVAWEVWADREIVRPGCWSGDLIDTFDNEPDAISLRRSLEASDANA